MYFGFNNNDNVDVLMVTASRSHLLNLSWASFPDALDVYYTLVNGLHNRFSITSLQSHGLIIDVPSPPSILVARIWDKS